MNTSVSVSGLVSPSLDVSAVKAVGAEFRLDSVGRREIAFTLTIFPGSNGTLWWTRWNENSDVVEKVGDFHAGVHPLTFTDLLPIKNYQFFMTGVGSPPPSLTVKTLGANPTPPNHFTPFYQSENEVYFFWDGGEVDTGEPRYEIRRDGVLLEVVDKPPYRDNTPMQGRDHKYCIRTVDEEFLYSDPVCVVVKFEDFTAPTDPSSVRTSNLGLTLSWDESYDSSGDITYIVDQGIGNELGRTKEVEFAVTGLELGKRYEFGVTATDKAGHLSNRVTVHYPAQGIPLKGKL